MSQTPVSFRLDSDLLERVRKHLRNPINNRTKHGALSALVSSLLSDWVLKQAQLTTQEPSHDDHPNND